MISMMKYMLCFHEEDETSILAGASKTCVKLLLSSVSQNMTNMSRLNLSVSIFLLYAQSMFLSWTLPNSLDHHQVPALV